MRTAAEITLSMIFGVSGSGHCEIAWEVQPIAFAALAVVPPSRLRASVLCMGAL